MNGSSSPKTVPEIFFRTCARFPSRPAQRFNANLYQGDNNGRYTYGEMRESVEKIACGLLSLGMEKQDRVALMSRSTPYWTQADMAAAACGGVSAALSPTLPAGEAISFLTHARCRYLFVDAGESLDGILGRISELPALERIVVVDFAHEGDGGRVMGLRELLDRGGKFRSDNRGLLQERVQGVSPDDGYTILYTPGTGPGGALLTHSAVVSRLEGMNGFLPQGGLEITRDDVALCCLPLSGVFERVACQLLALCEGACIAYGDGEETLFYDLRKYNPTWLNVTPDSLEKIRGAIREHAGGTPLARGLFDLACHAGRKALDYRRDHRDVYNMHPAYELERRLPLGLKIQYRLADRLFSGARALFGRRFRFAFSSGDSVGPDLLHFFYTLGIAVVEGYGLAETAGPCILNPLTSCKPGYLGVASCGARTRVAPDGELQVGGPGLFAGYPGFPRRTEEAFTPDGWLRTGDLVDCDGCGYFRMAGRKPVACAGRPGSSGEH